jgi:hypothetical protein
MQVTYLTDVMDHASTVAEDMEVLAEDARSLIDLVFNIINVKTNSSMQVCVCVQQIQKSMYGILGVASACASLFSESVIRHTAS